MVRENEFYELLSMIDVTPYGKFLIYGDAGCGKTYLLNVLGKMLEQNGKKVVSAAGLAYRKYSKYGYYDIDFGNTVFLLDGLDELHNYRFFVEFINKYKGCYVCTSREIDYDIKFDYRIHLQSLTKEQILRLINESVLSKHVNNSIKEEILSIGENITPQYISEILMSYNGFQTLSDDLEENSHQLYTYGKGLSITHPEIIVPECKKIQLPKQIKKDVQFITHSLWSQIVDKPEILYSITPRQFEEFVCELFEKQGYNVKLTKQTRDGGKDIVVLNETTLGDFIICAECKKRAPKNKVGIDIVRELYGVVEQNKATAGVIITTSSFTKDAVDFRNKIKGRMNFIDYTELLKQISEFR